MYEWSAGQSPSAPLSLISLLPAEHGEEAVAASPALGSENRVAGAVSDDGSRVVWHSNATGHLYLRDVVRGQTVQLDVAQVKVKVGPAPVFQAASSDGSRVLFTDEQPLLSGSGRGSGDLYECEMVEGPGGLGCELHDLTPKVGSEEAEVVGSVLGASRDGSWVYFVADGKLAPGAEHGTCASSGSTTAAESCDLYVRHAGETRLVAVLSGADYPDWKRELEGHLSRVSGDGEWLAFMSERSLTGYGQP